MIRRLEPVSCATASPLSILHRACFPEDPWDVPTIAAMASIAGFFGRIAWADEMLAGFALALDLGKIFEILSLGVVPEHRRAGIGLALLDSVCFEARLCGAEYVMLEVAVDSIAARALYAKRGFTPIGWRRNYYRQAGRSIDALVLRLPVETISLPTRPKCF